VGSNPLGTICIFLKNLARRRLHGGMRIGFAGRENENDIYRMVAEHGNGLCVRRSESVEDNMKFN
jgi:hypothetical protein